jgi:hypothetical protein
MFGSLKVIGEIKQFRVIAELLEYVNRLQRLRVYASK